MSATQPKARKRSVPVSVKIGTVTIGLGLPVGFLAGMGWDGRDADDLTPSQAIWELQSTSETRRLSALGEVYRDAREAIRAIRRARDAHNGDTKRDAVHFLNRLAEDASK